MKQFDTMSYVLGHQKGYSKGTADGKSNVELDSTSYTFTDDGEGNITITED